MASGERLTIIGVDRDGVGEILADGLERKRGALLVTCRGFTSTLGILERLLDDLADLALAHWPHWDESDASRTAEEAGPPNASLSSLSSDPWWAAAARRASLGLSPRFHRMARELEFNYLLRAVGSLGVILVWEVDPASGKRAGPVIDAIDWCARHGAAVVTTLTVLPPAVAPYDRILYGALELACPQATVRERFIAPTPGAHHASVIEQRVAAALAQDDDLRGLFVCNAPVAVGDWGARVRVDLLCSAHLVVVELDGPEHRAEPKFGADRHRDYQLLTSGYLILRLTNEQVAADLALSIEKIRGVVDLRRRRHEG
ncbi:hypothetical protein ASF25_20795 [Methylobacterium sp. Leaf100]|nr:hypothetical protein ASF25_20795 [Methylobacterium sp. Leaf100]